MQGLSEHASVIYVGTFAKILFPSLRLGFMVLPKNLSEDVKLAINTTGQFAPLMLQAALADFIGSGQFFLHLNRMRRLYGHRRKIFLRLADQYAGKWLTPLDYGTGIQITLLLDHPMSDVEIADAGMRCGLNLAPLSAYQLNLPKRQGFVMGYAGIPEKVMEEGFVKLNQILEARH